MTTKNPLYSMKNLYLYTLAVIALLASCRKKDDIFNPPPQTEPGDSIQVSFFADTIGLTEMYESFDKRIPTFTITNGKPNKPFSFEIRGSNGLKGTSDTLTKGTGMLDANGNGGFVLLQLIRYKDGEITVTVTLDDPDTVITAKTQKTEFQIGSYLDFMHMGFYMHGDTSAHYVQLNDFAFPDTVFTASPVPGYLYGSYDGQGHKITNLTIRSAGTPPGTTSDVGLFMAAFRHSVIKNVRLELSEEGITSTGPGYYGGLVGHSWENASIINCSVKGNIVVTKAAAETYAGGIVGISESSNIIGCSFRGTVSGPTAGGIAGALAGESTVNMCYAYAAFDGPVAGGIAASGWSMDVNIANSYAVASSHPTPFLAISPAGTGVVVSNCFANAGTGQNGVTVAALPNINASLAAMTIANNWPQGVPRPANNKPYKSDTDLTTPMKLWWE